ncbi:uncharacterized protein LOC105209433 [Zeugodacus cucurbitae]|uniref:uncharacterized protein LOC105209433 n=1 Tax=Zeugodacus cucurbitae TaxID=28588 RepID=UPI0023D8F781|nr:uncharacterized protein LOC105209433 [Zeugodacus cucurbitae]
MSQHNYTNPAFCQGSEFYPTRGIELDSVQQQHVEAIYNRSLNISYGGHTAQTNARVGPLRLQRSMSTRSVNTQKRQKTTAIPGVHLSRLATQPNQHQYNHQQQQQQQQQQQLQRQSQHTPQQHFIKSQASTTPARTNQFNAVTEPANFETRSNSGRYALVPLEDLPTAVSNNNNSRYAIVPGPSAPLTTLRRYAKSQDNLDCYGSDGRLHSDDEPASFHEEPNSFHGQTTDTAFTSLPPVFERARSAHPITKQPQPLAPKIKHAFSSDFGSKTFLIVDKNSNQRYQMVPTAEDEELVDDNQEIIQMHNGRAHRYAVIPTEEEADHMLGAADEEEETCLSNSDLNRSENFFIGNTMKTPRNATMRTSTPQKLPAASQPPSGNTSYPGTPMKNPVATKMLHELLSTPRKTPLPRSVTPRNLSPMERLPENQQPPEQQRTKYHYRSQQQLCYNTPIERRVERTAQSLHYESVKTQGDRTMAVITPRITAHQSKVYPEVAEEDCSSIHGKSSNTTTPYPQKVANATVTLAIVSLMMVISNSMNSALIIYMIAHFGKSFYLQYSLVSAFSGVGLGFLGFRSRHCEWLPNRSYISGYILLTVFSLLKCCCLVVILVLDPYPGLPLHDVTTGIILGLSTFTIFFIGLGVIGSLWCYRPPPDNRVNVA